MESQRRIAGEHAKNGGHAGDPIDMENPARAGFLNIIYSDKSSEV